jgi:hypothetical protein
MAEIKGEKSVEELAQIFKNLNDSGLLEKFLEEAQKKKGEAKTETKELVKELVKEEESKIEGVLKIELWKQNDGKNTKTVQLISSNDFTTIYNAKNQDLFAFDILEMGKQNEDIFNIIEKPIIAAEKIHSALAEARKIDLSLPDGMRSIKVEKGLEPTLQLARTNITVNEKPCQIMKLLMLTDQFTQHLCLVQNSDLESFPKVDFVDDLKKDSSDKFCVINSWFSNDIGEKTLVSLSDINKIPIALADKRNERAHDIAITHAMDIDKNCVAREKHVIVHNPQLDPNGSRYNKAIRIGSAAVATAHPILINGKGFQLLLKGGCSFNKNELISTMTFKDEVEYTAAHATCVIEKSVFEGLTFISPKNKEPHKTEYNKIYHYHINNVISDMMIVTAAQIEEMKNNTKYKSACMITFFLVKNNNISEELAITHTTWRDHSIMLPMFKFDNQEKSKWLKGYMRRENFDTLKKGEFTFESKPAVFMTILLEGKHVDCFITKDQLEKINSA